LCGGGEERQERSKKKDSDSTLRFPHRRQCNTRRGR
jgi:hypothetical protein